MRMKDEDWDEVLTVNLTALPPHPRRLRGMMKPRFGRIIGITSVVGVIGNPGQANYAASKAGMIGMIQGAGRRSRHAQHHRQLRGAGLHRHGHDRRAERQAARGDSDHDPGRPARRRRRGRRRVVFLRPHEAAYVTGQTLHVNGGMAMI